MYFLVQSIIYEFIYLFDYLIIYSETLTVHVPVCLVKEPLRFPGGDPERHRETLFLTSCVVGSAGLVVRGLVSHPRGSGFRTQWPQSTCRLSTARPL